MATIGQQLKTPEEGWNRYDSTDGRINSVGTWGTEVNSGHYGGSQLYTTTIGSYCLIKFYGTGVRLMTDRNTNRGNTTSTVTIDGAPAGTVSTYGATLATVLSYETMGLSLGYHTIKVTLDNTTCLSLDAVDIYGGYLAHPVLNQAQTIQDAYVGDAICCGYTVSTAGAAGSFSEFGTFRGGLIPKAGQQTGSGAFYFIKVDVGLFIADRVIQTSIKSNAIGTAKYLHGAVNDILIPGLPVILRSISGGVSARDAQGNSTYRGQGLGAWPVTNEWDTYIMGSSLYGRITPGDDFIWNHSSIYTICQDTPIVGTHYDKYNNSSGAIDSARKTARGSYGATAWPDFNMPMSATAYAHIGFRPVLQYNENPKCSSLWY